MSLKNKTIGFIGGGNMAEALLSGLIRSAKARPTQIRVAEPTAARRNTLKRRYGVKALSDNQELVRLSDVIVLAVKPQVMSTVLSEIKTAVTDRQLIISIAAGIDTRLLHGGLGTKVRLIRVMPNSPALIGHGISGIFTSKTARAADLKLARELFSSVGSVLVFKRESLLDWVTAVSGSGPAYFFLCFEAFIDAAIKGGLSPAAARQLVLSTASGAAELAEREKTGLKELRQRVTSKGGTTEAALKVLKSKRWPEALQAAVKAAAKRAGELRKQ